MLDHFPNMFWLRGVWSLVEKGGDSGWCKGRTERRVRDCGTTEMFRTPLKPDTFDVTWQNPKINFLEKKNFQIFRQINFFFF